VTFRYTAEGPLGLLTGKKAFVFATRGGQHAGTETDLQTAYVRLFLGFIGIRDVEFIYAEGLALGEQQRERALAAAAERINRLAA
jgi:FMN-dependent NADH-azoreductase